MAVAFISFGVTLGPWVFLCPCPKGLVFAHSLDVQAIPSWPVGGPRGRPWCLEGLPLLPGVPVVSFRNLQVLCWGCGD